MLALRAHILATRALADVPPAVLRIRDALRAQAVSHGATFYDPLIAGWFFGTPWLIGHDGVHPTDAGHAFLADRIALSLGDGPMPLGAAFRR